MTETSSSSFEWPVHWNATLKTDRRLGTYPWREMLGVGVMVVRGWVRKDRL